MLAPSQILRTAVLATAMLAASPAAAAADKLTLLLDWFVNPDHAPIIVAEQARLLRRPGPRGRDHRAGRPERSAQAGRRRPGRHRDRLPAAAAHPGRPGPAAHPHRHAGGDAAQRAGGARGRPGRVDRGPQGRQGRLLGRRLRGRAARRDAGRARHEPRRHRAGQRQLRALAGAAVRPGRRGDRRVPQFRAQPARDRGQARASRSIPRRRACRPTTS